MVTDGDGGGQIADKLVRAMGRRMVELPSKDKLVAC